MANPWFPFYVDDYERKTSHLTLLERGAYSELIRRYYMIGGPLPAIALQVHRMCRATDQQECDSIDYCLSEFFRLEADGYHNDRCDEELAKSRSISEKRAKSASLRQPKTPAIAPANAPANAQQLQTQLQPQLQPHKKTRSKAKAGASAFVLPTWIDPEVWKAYEEMRHRIKKPPGDFTRKRTIGDLAKLRECGHDANEILGRSIDKCWTGVFAPKNFDPGGNGNGTNKAEQRQANNLRACDEAKRMLRMGGGAVDITRGSSRGEPDASTIDDERPEPF